MTSKPRASEPIAYDLKPRLLPQPDTRSPSPLDLQKTDTSTCPEFGAKTRNLKSHALHQLAPEEPAMQSNAHLVSTTQWPLDLSTLQEAEMPLRAYVLTDRTTREFQTIKLKFDCTHSELYALKHAFFDHEILVPDVPHQAFHPSHIDEENAFEADASIALIKNVNQLVHHHGKVTPFVTLLEYAKPRLYQVYFCVPQELLDEPLAYRPLKRFQKSRIYKTQTPDNEQTHSCSIVLQAVNSGEKPDPTDMKQQELHLFVTHNRDAAHATFYVKTELSLGKDTACGNTRTTD